MESKRSLCGMVTYPSCFITTGVHPFYDLSLLRPEKSYQETDQYPRNSGSNPNGRQIFDIVGKQFVNPPLLRFGRLYIDSYGVKLANLLGSSPQTKFFLNILEMYKN